MPKKLIKIKKYKRFKNGKWENVKKHQRNIEINELNKSILNDIQSGKSKLLIVIENPMLSEKAVKSAKLIDRYSGNVRGSQIDQKYCIYQLNGIKSGRYPESLEGLTEFEKNRIIEQEKRAVRSELKYLRNQERIYRRRILEQQERYKSETGEFYEPVKEMLKPISKSSVPEYTNMEDWWEYRDKLIKKSLDNK